MEIEKVEGPRVVHACHCSNEGGEMMDNFSCESYQFSDRFQVRHKSVHHTWEGYDQGGEGDTPGLVQGILSQFCLYVKTSLKLS